VRIALGLEYDGHGYAGWQSQPEGNTLQDALEAALAIIAGEPLRVTCAGRTDAGVHAVGQVVHFDVAAQRPLSAWVRGVNSHLPTGMAVRWARAVSDRFHARNCARARRYRYLLLNRPQRPGLLAGRVGWFHQPLDVQVMQQAGRCLIGEHDFSAFRAAECQARSPVKIMHQVSIARQGECIVFDFCANAFLHHMVRNLVGALVFVGKGRRPVEWLAELLASGDRTQGAPTFAASGLYFVGPEYDPVWELPLPEGLGNCAQGFAGHDRRSIG